MVNVIPVRRTLAVLAAMSFLFALPVGAADLTDNTGCVNLLYMQYGAGIHVVAGVVGEITLRVSSNAPQDGVTVGFIIYPQLCQVDTEDLTDVWYASSESTPGLPVAPPPAPEFPTLP